MRQLCPAGAPIPASDDGPGLPVGVRKRLFARESRGRNPSYHGHGLAIARELSVRARCSQLAVDRLWRRRHRV